MKKKKLLSEDELLMVSGGVLPKELCISCGSEINCLYL